MLGFSAYEYFQWVPYHAAPGWRRKRPWREFVVLAQLMAEVDGSLTQESVLNDPEVIKWMAKERQRRGGAPRLWGYTKEIAMLATIVDAQIRKPVMKRPELPADIARQKETQKKLRKTLSRIGVE